MYFKNDSPVKMNFEKVLHRTKSLGNGIIMVYGLKDNQFICKLEKSKNNTWNIVESSSKYVNYGYETKVEAVASAIYRKDCRIHKTGL